MADPLSIATGVTGILTAAAQVSSILLDFKRSIGGAQDMAKTVMLEINDLTTILSQLQNFIIAREQCESTRTSLLRLDQIVTIVSGCVLTFSELRTLLDNMKSTEMQLIDKVKWVRRQAEIKGLTSRLNTHKTSLSLMLDVLNGYIAKREKLWILFSKAN